MPFCADLQSSIAARTAFHTEPYEGTYFIVTYGGGTPTVTL